MKKILKDNRGMFGLNAVQSFFAIIVGIALLAYVIVIIMGTLSTTSIIPLTTAQQVNESITFNALNTPVLMGARSYAGYVCGSLTSVTNGTNVGLPVLTGNFTVTSDCTIVNATRLFGYVGANVWNASSTQFLTYTFSKNTGYANDLNNVLTNTSTGISGFFNSINPVYAILAILVIILVLVVLVRVVSAPNTRREGTSL